MADSHARVLTLLFTDLADSTALKTERGDVAIGELIARHRELVTRLSVECSGRIIDWAGDGCFLTFETSSTGVQFALNLQQRHAAELELPAVRIGIHVGEVTERPGPGEAPRIEGLAVDIAARISGLAKPGQVLMSATVSQNARQRLTAETFDDPIRWRTYGPYTLKGFDEPVDIREAGFDGISPLEEPSDSEKAKSVKDVRDIEAQKEVRRFHCLLSPSLPFDSGLNVSPDGRCFAYVTKIDGIRQLVIRKFDELEAHVVANTQGARRPFFSPDGEWVGFFSHATRSLNKISIHGGHPVTLCRNVAFHFGACWGEDDRIAFTRGAGEPIFQVAGPGGAPERLTELDLSMGDAFHSFPYYVEGRNAILYTASTGIDADQSRIVVLDIYTGEQRTIVERATRPRFASTGHITFTQRGAVSVAPFNVERLELDGPIVPVSEAGLVGTESDLAHYAFSRSGVIVYVPMGIGSFAPSNRELVWVDRSGKEEPIAAPAKPFRMPRVSPDGTQVAVSVDDSQDVWAFDFNRATMSRLTFGNSVDLFPLWSPDNRRVAFTSNRDGQYNIYCKTVDGSGSEERLTNNVSYQAVHSWSRDGKLLAYVEINSESGRNIGLITFKGKPSSRLILTTPHDERTPSISSDSRWLAYACDESGRHEIYVQSLPDLKKKWQISNGGGSDPVWSPDGRELFYRVENKMMSVPIDSDPTFTFGNPSVLFDRHYYEESMSGRNYDIAPDGKRFLMMKESNSIEDQRTRTELVVVENWFEELKRIAPAPK